MLYTRTPPDFSLITEHLCYIKYYNTELKRTNFIANSYEKDYNDEVGVVLIIKGFLKEKDQKINLLENLNQVIYSVQLANPQSWWIEDEYLEYNATYSLELDAENNLTLTLYKDERPNIDYTVSREPKLIKT